MGKCTAGGLIKRFGDRSSLGSVLYKHSSSHRKGWTCARAHRITELGRGPQVPRMTGSLWIYLGEIKNEHFLQLWMYTVSCSQLLDCHQEHLPVMLQLHVPWELVYPHRYFKVMVSGLSLSGPCYFVCLWRSAWIIRTTISKLLVTVSLNLSISFYAFKTV